MDNPNNYIGPNAAGVQKGLIPDWLDHTANAMKNEASRTPGAMEDHGPGAAGAVTIINPSVYLP
jgi:hypothetical protein